MCPTFYSPTCILGTRVPKIVSVLADLGHVRFRCRFCDIAAIDLSLNLLVNQLRHAI